MTTARFTEQKRIDMSACYHNRPLHVVWGRRHQLRRQALCAVNRKQTPIVIVYPHESGLEMEYTLLQLVEDVRKGDARVWA